jgi:hypothetical protein
MGRAGVTQLLAWMGLIAVLCVYAHWALQALGRRVPLPAPLQVLGRWARRLNAPFDADLRADRRRQERVQRARLQREAIARASEPVPLDEAVSWEGNVARAPFGRKPTRAKLH